MSSTKEDDIDNKYLEVKEEYIELERIVDTKPHYTARGNEDKNYRDVSPSQLSYVESSVQNTIKKSRCTNQKVSKYQTSTDAGGLEEYRDHGYGGHVLEMNETGSIISNTV